MRSTLPFLVLMFTFSACAQSQQISSTQPAGNLNAENLPADKLPHVHVDVKARQIRVDCQMLGVQVPLEFFCVVDGTNEHESVLRTPARPSHIHLALLMLGLEPGSPVHFSEAKKEWLPPSGPPLSISAEFVKDGKTVRVPASRMMRSIKTHEPMPQRPFIFAGSALAPDGTYAADVTGYVVSIVNFDLSMIDVPELASNANETLEWEINFDVCPPVGSPVTMIIEPMDHGDSTPATTEPTTQSSENFHEQPPDIAEQQKRIAALREKWQQAVAPHQKDLREAAQAHYEVIKQLRAEQQRLIDEADRIQRLIDDLEKQYQEMTTPQPTQSPNSQPDNSK